MSFGRDRPFREWSLVIDLLMHAEKKLSLRPLVQAQLLSQSSSSQFLAQQLQIHQLSFVVLTQPFSKPTTRALDTESEEHVAPPSSYSP